MASGGREEEAEGGADTTCGEQKQQQQQQQQQQQRYDDSLSSLNLPSPPKTRPNICPDLPLYLALSLAGTE